MRAATDEAPSQLTAVPSLRGRDSKRLLAAWWTSWPVRDVLLPFVTTRLLLCFVGWLALLSFRNLPTNPGSWELKADGQIALATPYLSPDTYPLLNVNARWDSAWYHSIAKHGYSFVPDRQSNTAFFPMYPLLMRAVHLAIPSDTDASWMLAGWIVANAALLVALCYLVLLVRLDFDHDIAARSVLYLLVFPTTFFFSAVYSESVFLAAAIGAFYHARRNQWLAASLFAGAATLTRSPGILLVAPLLLEYMAQRRFQWREIRMNVAALLIAPACLAGHMLYLKYRVGNLMAIQDAQRAWGGEWGTLSWPWKPALRFIREPFMFNDVMNFTFTAAGLALVVLAAVRLRAAYGLYAAICYWFITAWGTFESMPRYVLMIFPAFIVLARLGRNPVFDRAYVAIASGLAAFFMIRFALWRWVA